MTRRAGRSKVSARVPLSIVGWSPGFGRGPLFMIVILSIESYVNIYGDNSARHGKKTAAPGRHAAGNGSNLSLYTKFDVILGVSLVSVLLNHIVHYDRIL